MNIVEQHKNHAVEVPIFKALELLWSNKPIYMAAMTAGRPVMKALAQGEDALSENSTWMPVVKGWTSSRDFDVISETRFRTWFKKHKEEQAREAAEELGKGGDQ